MKLADTAETPAATPSREEIINIAVKATFARPLVTNVFRAVLAEAIVHRALGGRWNWVSADWAPYDFVHTDGTRLEVKQSAARQSWHNDVTAPSKPVFDIAPRTGAWDGDQWRPGPGRNAEIYVFAYHPLVTADCDHANPMQWTFYVVATASLPPVPQKRISLSTLSRLSQSFDLLSLGDAVEDVHRSITLR